MISSTVLSGSAAARLSDLSSTAERYAFIAASASRSILSSNGFGGMAASPVPSRQMLKMRELYCCRAGAAVKWRMRSSDVQNAECGTMTGSLNSGRAYCTSRRLTANSGSRMPRW